jgi:hypothetical protein
MSKKETGKAEFCGIHLLYFIEGNTESGLGCGSRGRALSSMPKALNSIPSTAATKTKQSESEQVRKTSMMLD